MIKIKININKIYKNKINKNKINDNKIKKLKLLVNFNLNIFIYIIKAKI